MKIEKLPDVFVQRMMALLGESYPAFESALTTVEPTSIRLHPSKGNENFVNGKEVPWESMACTLSERPIFALDPSWHAGAYYVQESSSMLTGAILKKIIAGMTSPRILDACAAPGGKSTHLLSIMNGNGLLVANEPIAKRNIILTENIQKWGYPNVIVTKESTHNIGLLNQYFDILMVDAPCSGEGLFRKDPEAIGEWSEQAVDTCANRQTDILRDLIPALKLGGYLCYSTCTFEKSENEEQVQGLLDEGSFELIHLNAKQYDGLQEGYLPGTIRCWPHKTSGSGFFLALLRKIRHEPSSQGKARVKASLWKPLKQLPDAAERFIRTDDQLCCWGFGESIRLFPKSMNHDLQWLLSQLNVMYFGIEVGSLRKEIFTPSHQLTYTQLIQDQIPHHTVDLPTALDFLRKNPITIPSAVMGWALIKYNGLCLGWVKILSDRVNNYLPTDKMLRMK